MISKLISGRVACARWSMTRMTGGGCASRARRCRLGAAAARGGAGYHSAPGGPPRLQSPPSMRPTPVLARGWRPLALAGDAAVALGALALAFAVRVVLPLPCTEGLLPAARLALFAREAWVVLASQIIALYFFGLYDPPTPRQRDELARRLLRVQVWQALAL